MTTEMITLKLDNRFLDHIDTFVAQEGYQSRTEFIRTALREKVERTILKHALTKMKGVSTKKTTQHDLELLRKKAFELLE